MPFTIAHPAIVIPFTFLPKKWFSITGLILGSMLPDFEYFIRFQIKSTFSHTILGTFYFCLPLGLILAYVFHNYVKKRLIYNLPYIFQKKCSVLLSLNWNNYLKKNMLVVMYSLIIGSFTHLFWDGFTHHDGYFVTKIPQLCDVISINQFDFYAYKILQHLSTLIGVIMLSIAFLLLPNIEINNSTQNRDYWLAIFFSTILILFIRWQFGLTINQYGNIIVSLISSFIIALILISIFFKKYYLNNK